MANAEVKTELRFRIAQFTKKHRKCIIVYHISMWMKFISKIRISHISVFRSTIKTINSRMCTYKILSLQNIPTRLFCHKHDFVDILSDCAMQCVFYRWNSVCVCVPNICCKCVQFRFNHGVTQMHLFIAASKTLPICILLVCSSVCVWVCKKASAVMHVTWF